MKRFETCAFQEKWSIYSFMRVGVIGIHSRGAELNLREQLVKACGLHLGKQTELAQALSCVILPTCHRMEIYFSTEDLAEGHVQILDVLRQELKIEFDSRLYTYFGVDCFNHLAKVTAGLDSLILGESEIQKQVKEAYTLTAESYRLSADMHYLFQKSLKVGKTIRSSGKLDPRGNSLSQLLWEAGKSFFENCQSRRVLFVGNSEINRRTLSYFHLKGMRETVLCTRQVLEDTQQMGWDEINRWINYDMIICGTYSDSYVLTLPATEMLGDKLVVDLSVPRTVDPALRLHPQVTLLDMDRLTGLMKKRSSEQWQQKRQCEKMVDATVRKLMQLFALKVGIR